MDSILQRIASRSKEYLARVPPSGPLIQHAHERVHPVSLPEPPSLVPALVNAGAPITLAQELQRAYQQQAIELKHRYETRASQLALALSQHPGPSTSQSIEPELFATIEKLYTARLEDWLKDCLSRYKKHASVIVGREDCSHRSKGAHTTFNTEYVPLLEHFFEENAFPTHADKVRLAKKSGMTYRQIHVWFQNKRTRSRKERRKTVSNAATFPMGSPCNGTKQCADHGVRNGQSPPRCKAMVDKVPSVMQDPLDAPAPPHAFPSTYPPSPRYQPFPGSSTLQSHLLPWRRRPSPVRSPSPVATSISDLVEMFLRLSVRDDHSHCQQQHSFHTPTIGAAVSAITTKPLSAPLFATCGPVEFVTKTAFVPLPVVPAPILLHPFETPSPQARPVTLIPSSVQKASKHGRKVAPLPKRLPQVSIKTKHGSMRPTPDYSNHRCQSSASSVRSSSSESSPSVATTPEVGSPSLLDEVSPIRGSRHPIDQEGFETAAADSLSREHLFEPSSVSDPIYSTISENSVRQGNSNAIMRAMRRAIPPRHARFPLCVGS
ncbi:hypothetical protein EDD15DRAFT_2346126 [Pisolithus albus]|nr:hypothetical protein EDD15DRAFT_2346126 [Pisolithus albus]